MTIKNYINIVFCLLVVPAALFGQQMERTYQLSESKTKRIGPYILPGTMFISGGLLVMTHSPLHGINTEMSKGMQRVFPDFHTKTDNWLQYVSGGGVLVLGAAGVSGEHPLGNQFFRYAISTVIATGTVQALKKWTHVLRPDGTTYNSFPSGHTATAFTGAELMHQEYGKKSVWFSVLGYSLASATGVMRMLNNRHSLADVLGGAGIGMASVRFSYWLADRWAEKRKPRPAITF